MKRLLRFSAEHLFENKNKKFFTFDMKMDSNATDTVTNTIGFRRFAKTKLADDLWTNYMNVNFIEPYLKGK